MKGWINFHTNMPTTCTFSSTWKNFFQSFHYIICCWASPSFMMNSTCLQMFRGIRVGISCWKTHKKLKHCWFGVQIQRNKTCLSTDVRQENVRRQNPPLFEWEVTSHQTTSGHNMNSHKAGIVVHPMFWKELVLYPFFYHASHL